MLRRHVVEQTTLDRLVEDRDLEFGERRRRVDPKVLREHVPEVSASVEGVPLASGQVLRPGERAPRLFLVGALGDRRPCLRLGLVEAALPDEALGPVEPGHGPGVHQSSACRPVKGQALDAAEWFADPGLKGRSEQAGRARCIAAAKRRTALGHVRDELRSIDRQLGAHQAIRVA